MYVIKPFFVFATFFFQLASVKFQNDSQTIRFKSLNKKCICCKIHGNECEHFADVNVSS